MPHPVYDVIVLLPGMWFDPSPARQDGTGSYGWRCHPSGRDFWTVDQGAYVAGAS
jgi:hypothetical protein